MGPTYDKRIKPDLVAGGDYIMAALANDKDQPTCSVHAMSGTSMATPRVAASALLVRELLMNNTILQEFCNQFFPFDNADHNNAVLNKPCWYNQDIQKPPEPSGYLLKTILTHSTIPVSRYSMDLYNAMGFKYYPNSFPLKAPPDNIQGFGQSDMMDYMDSCVNTDSNQVLMLFDRLLIESYSSIDFMLKIDSNYISSSSSELKVTLSWYDPPHTIGFAEKWLIHDLDLVINAPCGETFNGNENYLRDNNYKNEEGDFKDENNNIEQIQIPLQTSSCDNNDNVYKVSVISNALPYNVTQSFALVISAPAGVIVSQNDEASHKILNRPSTNISRSSEAHLRSRSRNTQQEDCNNFVREVGFQDLLLEIRLNVVTDVSFQPVIKLLEEFHAIGSFQGISLHISDQSKTVTDRYIVGSDAFMFTVIITDPSGNQAQVINILSIITTTMFNLVKIYLLHRLEAWDGCIHPTIHS